MSRQALLRRCLPPPLFDALLRATGHAPRFSGPYANWTEALRHAHGYDDPSLVAKVAAATRDVLAGRAAFERDSVSFSEPAMPCTVLAMVLRHALLHPGPLHVIDFGGSLGSTYRQCRPYLPPIAGLKWHVVEQASYVAVGRAEFTTDELDFHESLDEIPDATAPRFLLVSGSLQYMQQPAAQIDAFARVSAATLFVDRLPLAVMNADALCVQHAPKFIHSSSYPSWVFSRPRLLDQLASDWHLVGEHPCPRDGSFAVPGGATFDYRGLLFERKGL